MPDASVQRTAGARDAWTGGEAYEPFIGRWSRLVAAEFVAWLQVSRGATWLDVGCGTGALTSAIVMAADPAHVVGIDASPAYAAFARDRIGDAPARFAVADARALPLPSDSASAAVSGLVLNFVPAPERAVAELARVTRPGGIVACYVWDYAGRMELLRHFWDAAATLDPRARELDEGLRFPVCEPHALEALWRAADLEDVSSRAIDVPTRFRDFAEFWRPFLGGQGPAPGYVATLDAPRREALRAALEARLPRSPDGSIALTARAWAVRGRRRQGSSRETRPSDERSA